MQITKELFSQAIIKVVSEHSPLKRSRSIKLIITEETVSKCQISKTVPKEGKKD